MYDRSTIEILGYFLLVLYTGVVGEPSDGRVYVLLCVEGTTVSVCVHLRNLTIGQIYYRLRDEVMSEVPTCRDKWQSSLGRPINTTMWEHLWLVPHGFQLITPYFRDILWKFLHRVLPTKAQLVKCRLADNSVCLACQSFEESIDHVYGHCIKWKQYIALAAALLHRLGGPAPSTSLHPLEFLLQRVQFDSQRSCEYWHALLLVIYWQK